MIPADPAVGLAKDMTLYENAMVIPGTTAAQQNAAKLAFLQVPDMIQHTLAHLSLPILFLKTARIFWSCFLCSDRLVHHNLSCHNHRVRRPTDLGGSFDGILQPSLESYASAVRARGPLCRA